MRKTLPTPPTQTPSLGLRRATPRRRAVLGILFAPGMVVACKEPATVTVPTAIAITGADTVNVAENTRLTVTLTPANADAGVMWAIVGNDASDSKGTIDTTGLYTAPASVPTPATVTIKATSVVAIAIIATREITVLQ